MTPTLTVSSYEAAVSFVEGLDISAMKLGLERVTSLLDTLGNPQDQLPMVHIAGTNGKGSTTAMLASVLSAAGYKVGSFTSPHLVDLRERICLNGAPITKADFTRAVADLVEHLERLGWPRSEWPTYFEFLNVLAYRYFQQQGVDITVFETGLGGRLDSTNVVKQPNVCIITTIALDHVERLGGTLAAIAGEKAGIIKPQVPVVLGPSLPPEAMMVICHKAEQENAPVLMTEPNSLLRKESPLPGTQTFYEPTTSQKWTLSLLGTYQQENLSIVLKALEELRRQGFQLPPEAVAKGLQAVHWPGRFQYFQQERLVIDGSHNEQGFESLQCSLIKYFPDVPLYWLLSLRANREVESLLAVVNAFPNTQGVLWTQGSKAFLYHAPEAMQEKTVATQPRAYSVQAFSDATAALAWLEESLSRNRQAVGIATGSLYTAGELLKALAPKPILHANPPDR